MRVRSLKCPSCGGLTRLEHGQKEAQCIHCGQPVRLSQAVLQEQDRARQYPHTTPIRLGMKATFEGREYEAIGRQVMRELDDEGVSTWEEWVLVAPDGDLVYLEFDEGKWKSARPFVPETPVGPDVLTRIGEGTLLGLDGQRMLVTSKGQYQIGHAEGEFPFMVRTDRMVGYLDAMQGARFVSIEWTEDSIEYYQGRFLDERMVYTMFDLRDLLAEFDRRGATLRSKRGFGSVCLALSALVLGVWVYSMMSGVTVPKGKGSVDLAQVGPEGMRFGPIPLKSANRVHKLEIHGSMRERSVWVQAILEDDEDRELIATERDMWDESGSDSDGYWHESDLHGSTYFVLKKPGNYYVRMYAEGSPPLGTATASFELKQEAIYPTYLAVFGFGSLVMGFLFVVAGSPGAVKAAANAASSDD